MERGDLGTRAPPRVVGLIEGEQHQAKSACGGAVAGEKTIEIRTARVLALADAACVEKESVPHVLEGVAQARHLVADPGAVRPAADANQVGMGVDEPGRIDAVERLCNELVGSERFGEIGTETGIEEPDPVRGRGRERSRGCQAGEHSTPRNMSANFVRSVRQGTSCAHSFVD